MSIDAFTLNNDKLPASELDCIIIEYLENGIQFQWYYCNSLYTIYSSISCLQCIYMEDEYFLCILGDYEIKHDNMQSHHVHSAPLLSRAK